MNEKPVETTEDITECNQSKCIYNADGECQRIGRKLVIEPLGALGEFVDCRSMEKRK